MSREPRWNKIKSEISSCSRCPLSLSRAKVVPGEGNLYSDIVLLGEAPGRSEDEEGRPFVGAAGKLLDKVIDEVGFKREQLFITNVVKCRPPNNREPRLDEIITCSYFTDEIISLVNPNIVVALGNYAGYYLFELKGSVKWVGVTKMRGRAYRLSILGSWRWLVPTYHPAAVLYNPKLYEVFKEDISLLKKVFSDMKDSSRGLLKFIESRR
ncbi:MAG: uracil-DNA glycosylase [Sulfolobales archaeon]|nr:uracil-DNA glycosylase [Sulfolobales archaeon]MDW8083387.1 uracil-DNA glycosylase [Sulfolobales archaeon]